MKYLSILALVAIPLTASADRIRVDTTYDNTALPADELVCYDSYLSSKGYVTLGDASFYPNVAAYAPVTNAGPSYCGTCHNITFGDNTVSVIVVDELVVLDDPNPGYEAPEPAYLVPSIIAEQLYGGPIGPDESFDGQVVQVDYSTCDPEFHTDCVDC